jgi:hypothetical protein
MELIPVLSTIILIATISTFLLAIGAYVLYKVRESKGQKSAPPVPSTINAELLTPAEAPKQYPQQIYVEPKPAPSFQQRQPVLNLENRFLKYTSEGYVDPSEDERSSGRLKWR